MRGQWVCTKFELEGFIRFCYSFPMNIGTKLHELRIAKGFSQGDIEKRTGLLRCYLSRVENGHTVPNLETLRKWSEALEVEMYQLFFEGEGKPQPIAISGTEKVGPEVRGLIEVFSDLSQKDRKFVVALVRKMARERQTAKRAT